MNHYPATIINLIRHISRLPGIGEKTAERLALHILRAPRAEVEKLAASILDVKAKTRLCTMCYSLSDAEHCRLCSDSSRDARLLCVVERPADMIAIEKSGAFRGRYHVLGGALSPMDGVGPDKIRIRELIQRVSSGGIEEVVLATSTSVEGEATADYLQGRLSGAGVRISRIASGVPMGGDLKYVDQVTLKRAMEARREMP